MKSVQYVKMKEANAPRTPFKKPEGLTKAEEEALADIEAKKPKLMVKAMLKNDNERETKLIKKNSKERI